MLKSLLIKAAAAGLITSILFIPVHASPQAIKIRVVSADAAVYAKPDMNSQVIQNPPRGTVLEAEELAGDWYRVRVRSRVGMMITGYIHQRLVEVEGRPAAKPAVKTPQRRQEDRPARAARPRGELAIRFGTASGSFLNDSSRYSETWSETLLENVTETGTLTHSVKSPMGLGLAFGYQLFGSMAIQLKVDYNFTTKIEGDDQLSTYRMTWSWTNGEGPYDRTKDWPVGGEVSVIPLSFNLLIKPSGGGMFAPYLSGGVSYMTASVKADSQRGWGYTWIEGDTQYIDYIDIPLSVDESISHVGFNIGGGLDLLFSPNFGLNLDACYYVGKKTQVTWQPRAGTYAGNLWPDSSVAVSQDNVEALAAQVSPLEVNTSFFKLQAGIKLLF